MRKKSPYFRTSSFSNMAVRGGLTRCARPTGSPLASLPVCPTGCRQLSNPGRVFSSPPQACNMRKKSPYFRTSSHLEYGGEGGIDSLRSPCGQPARFAPSLSNWLRQLSNPGRRFLSPRRRAICEKKARTFVRALISNMAVRGGLTRCARPAGSPLALLPVCPTGCRQLSNPGRVFSSPPQACNMRKKSPYFRTSSHLEYGGEGGIDSLRSPCGQPARFAPGLSNWLSPVVEPRSGVLIPPAGVQYAKKKPVLSYELSSRIWR
jgi:hypothetical protein